MTKKFRKGDLIIRQGDIKDKNLYIVSRGKLAVKRSVDNGSVIDCGILRAGDLFGEVSMILGTARAATIMALDDEVEVQQLNKNQFYETIQENPDIAWKVLTKLALRTEAFDELQDQVSDPKKLRRFLFGK